MLFSIILLAVATTITATPITSKGPPKTGRCGPNQPIKLYATHYNGTISILNLDLDKTGKEVLTTNASAQACGESPSWLSYDPLGKTLYCSDEAGSLSSFTNGAELSLAAKIPTLGADVATTLYGGLHGRAFIANAHYNGNISTYSLPLSNTANILQKISYTQMNASHVHQVIADPSGKFLLAPDLGADVVHVLAFDGTTGKLTPQADLIVDTKSGPRHIAFKALKGKTIMYLAHELSNQVSSWELNHSKDQKNLEFKKIGSTSTFPDSTPPNIAISEIRVVNNNVYVGNRNTSTSPTNDSLTIFKIDQASGALKYLEQASTHGSYPRTFAFNKDRTLVAIGNQKSSTVVILDRDLKTGKLSKEFTSITIPGSKGLSSVIFAE